MYWGKDDGPGTSGGPEWEETGNPRNSTLEGVNAKA